MGCDLCGQEGNLFLVRIENTRLNVCNNCKGYGEVLERIKPPTRTSSTQTFAQRPVVTKNEVTEVIVSNYASLIKTKREKLGLKQEQLAKKLAEKESRLHKIETGHMKPSLKCARKLERFLNLKLVERYVEKPLELKRSESGPVTIGDMINLKS